MQEHNQRISQLVQVIQKVLQKGKELVITVNELSTLPTYEAKSFMLWVAKATEAYFENPDVKERFEKWKKERDCKRVPDKHKA